MMFGEAGLSLLEDARSSTLKPYGHAEVRILKSENAYLDMKMEKIKIEAESEISEELSVNYIMLKYFKERNERILRSYGFHRLRLLFETFFSKESVVHLLSTEEEEYVEKCSDALGEYLESFGMLDFTTKDPPIQFFVQILTLEDCGVVMDEGNFVELKKDRIYFIKKSTVIHLINSGLVRVT